MFQQRGEIPNRRWWDYDLHDEIEEAIFLHYHPGFCGINDFEDNATLGDEWLELRI
jgi:hypothetical protein